MEIQALKLFLTDADLAMILNELVSRQENIENLHATFTPEGVRVQGEYPTGFGFKVPFETLWQVMGAGSILHVHLTEIKVAGVPAGLLRGALLRMIRDAVESQPGIGLQDETILVDVPTVARANGLEVQITFTAVRLSIGTAVIEAG